MLKMVWIKPLISPGTERPEISPGRVKVALEMLVVLPLMSPFLPLMSPANAEDDIAKVKRVAQKTDLQRVMSSSPGWPKMLVGVVR